ncbi:MAG: hypothetical protein GY810_28940 [Aureispira sp.]|nr:hypothetical protein [Aureispira sp.]
MEVLETLNDRTIWYTENLEKAKLIAEAFENFCAYIIAENSTTQELFDIAKECLLLGINYLCASGKQGALIEDVFDEEVVAQNVENDLEKFLMTTHHKGVGEGLWFAIFLAREENKVIENLVCLNLTTSNTKSDILQHLKEIKKYAERNN